MFVNLWAIMKAKVEALFPQTKDFFDDYNNTCNNKQYNHPEQ